MVRWLVRLLAFAALASIAGFLWFRTVTVAAAPPNLGTDAIVVLTGDGGRVRRGLALLRVGAAPRLLISGVAEGVGPRQLARETHTPLALFRCCVDLGHAAIDTRSNGEETADWASRHGVRSLRLVTSDYHMRRATLELGAELAPGVTILPEPVPSHIGWKVWMREYVKWLVRSVARRTQT